MHSSSGSAYNSSLAVQNLEIREALGPALGEVFSATLEEHIPAGGVVFEVGAGAGALHTISGEYARELDWTASDKSGVILEVAEQLGIKTQIAQLPNLPLKKESVDAIVGLSVLDTLPTRTVQESVARSFAALRPGGVLLHLMDLGPKLIPVLVNARGDGYLALPFLDKDEVGMGMHFINLDGAEAKIAASDLPQVAKDALALLISDPEGGLSSVPQLDEVITELGDMAAEAGLVDHTEERWQLYFGKRIGAMAQAAGFVAVRNGFNEKTVSRPRRDLSSSFEDALSITRKGGGYKVDRMHGEASPPDIVEITAGIHVFAARKPQ